jgi:polyferredoxin
MAMRMKPERRGASAIAWIVVAVILVVIFIVTWFLPPLVWVITLTIPIWLIFAIGVAIGLAIVFLLDREFDLGLFEE